MGSLLLRALLYEIGECGRLFVERNFCRCCLMVFDWYEGASCCWLRWVEEDKEDEKEEGNASDGQDL